MKKKYAQELVIRVKKNYSLIAKDFSRTRKEPWPEIKFLFQDYLSPKNKVLDLGCGNGRYFSFFQESRVEYLGIDNCEALIGIAKKKYPQAQFQIGSALSLPFSSNSFNNIYSIAVLHQVPSNLLRIQFLKEVKRTLKPNGTIILTVWKLHRFRDLFRLIRPTFLKLVGLSRVEWRDAFIPWGKKTKRYYHYFSKPELERLVLKAGLRIKKSGIVKNKRGNRQNIYIVAEKI